MKYLRILLIISAAALVVAAQKPELYIQSGHAASISKVAFSPDGKLFATADSAGVVKLWDAANEFELRTLTSNDPPRLNEIKALTFSSDGMAIYASDGTDTVSWEIETGKKVSSFANGAIAFSEDRSLLAARLGTGNRLEIRTVGNAKVIEMSSIRGLFITKAVFSPDGKRIAVLAVGKDPDSTCDVWDVRSGRRVLSFDNHSNRIDSVTFSNSGSTLAVGTKDGKVILLDVDTGRDIATLDSGNDARLSSVAISKDERFLISRDDFKIYFWEMSSRKLLFDVATGYSSTVSSSFATFSFDEKRIIANERKTLSFVDISSRAKTELFGAATQQIKSVASSKDGKVFATGNSIGAVTLWDTTKDNPMSVLHAQKRFLTVLAFSPNGKTLASASWDGSVALWDVESRKLKALIKDAAKPFTKAMAFSPDGKLLATCSDDDVPRPDTDKSVRVWDAETGAAVGVLGDYKEAPNTLEFSPNGNELATGGRDNLVVLWDLRSGKKVRTLTGHKEPIRSIAFSADGETLATGGFFDDAKVIRLWDLSAGTELGSFRVKDPRQILRGGESKEALEIQNRQALRAVMARVPEFIRKNTNPYYFRDQEAWIGDDSLSIEAADNGILTFVSLESGKSIAQVVSLGDKDWAIVTPDGLFDGSPSAWRRLSWRLDTGISNFAPVEAFFNEFFHPGLLQQLVQGVQPAAPSTDLATLDIRSPELRIAQVPAVAQAGTGKSEVSIEVIENDKVRRRPEHPALSGARDLRLFRNGSLVKKWPGDVFSNVSGCEQSATKPGEPRKAICNTTVTITNGANQFTAYAFNSQNVKSNDATAVVKGADSLKRDGTVYVLAVGVNKYAAAGHDLTYAVADANRIGDEIAKRQLDIKKYARTEVIKLTDQNATKANVMLALKRFSNDVDVSTLPEPLRAELSKIKVAGPQDAIVFHFSGHGTARCQLSLSGSRNCDRFYLLPHDGFPVGVPSNAPNHLDAMFASSISDEDLEKLFEPIDAGNLLMIIDACNSGQALEAEEKRRGPMNSRGLAQLAYEKGMMILTASQSQQAALETSRLGHGLLTYSLVEGLKKAERTDNAIIDRNWFNYASTLVPQLQLEEMQKRDIEVKSGKRDIGVNFSEGEDKNLAVEKRSLQSPRLFYRREADVNPFVVAMP